MLVIHLKSVSLTAPPTPSSNPAEDEQSGVGTAHGQDSMHTCTGGALEGGYVHGARSRQNCEVEPCLCLIHPWITIDMLHEFHRTMSELFVDQTLEGRDNIVS